MKKRILAIGLVSSTVLFGSVTTNFSVDSSTIEVFQTIEKTETFKVYGNCGMCKKTIEASLKDVEGVEKADWNKDSKIMEITFDESVITLKEIKQKIADVGYDTDEISASSKAYNALPGCCQYERPAKSKSENEIHKH